MSNYTDFIAMSRSQATSYLDFFLSEMAPSMDRFATTVGHQLSYSPESLEQVWTTLYPAFAWRVGYVPPALGQPGPVIRDADLEPPQDLPSWFHHPSGAGYARFSAETLWVIDGAARYLGETAIRNGGGRWDSGNAKVKGYMFQNQPVLTGLAAGPVSPIQTCAVLVARALRQGPEQGPRTLAQTYKVWRAPGEDR